MANNDVAKKKQWMINWSKVNAFDTKVPSTSGLVFKTQYDSEKQNFEKKIEDVDKKILIASGLLRKC